MTDYDIPLSSVYADGEGTRVLIDGGRVKLVDRTGEVPHDLVPIRDSEIPELIEILVAHMATSNRYDRLSMKYEEHKDE